MNELLFDIKRSKSHKYDMTLITNMYNRQKGFTCLIDTGARVPVWCTEEQLLKTIYPDCIKQNAVFMLSGFGNGFEVANVYKIPKFILSDGKYSIMYNNLIVAVTNKDRDFIFDMILSYNMFNKMSLSIDALTDKNGTYIKTPNVKIKSTNDTYNVRCIKANIPNDTIKNVISKYGEKHIIDSICIFNQQ
ncbi:MAG: hypothetical protein NC400_06485 [Clostridium sp.]|nr:hypothetical protein [Clostridium sp.]